MDLPAVCIGYALKDCVRSAWLRDFRVQAGGQLGRRLWALQNLQCCGLHHLANDQEQDLA